MFYFNYYNDEFLLLLYFIACNQFNYFNMQTSPKENIYLMGKRESVDEHVHVHWEGVQKRIEELR